MMRIKFKRSVKKSYNLYKYSAFIFGLATIVLLYLNYSNETKEDLKITIEPQIYSRHPVTFTILGDDGDSLNCYLDFLFKCIISNNSKNQVVVMNAMPNYIDLRMSISNPFVEPITNDLIDFPLVVEGNNFRKFNFSLPIRLSGKVNQALLELYGEGKHTDTFQEIAINLTKKGINIYQDASIYGDKMKTVYDKFLKLKISTSKGKIIEEKFGAIYEVSFDQ